MKKLLFILLSLGTLWTFEACEEPNVLEFIAKPDPDGVAFINSFSDVYLLSQETADNIAERFLWDSADFDVPTNVTYELQGSIDPVFANFDLVGSTNATNLVITVDQLLDFAGALGLDDDPNTTDSLGNANNSGTVYFRLRAYAGSGTGANSLETLSDIISIDIEVVEKIGTGGGCDPIYVVGAAAVDAGWDWSTPIVFDCENNVYASKIKLTNETFRFFSTEGDWASGLNYPYFVGEGYTIDSDFEDAADGDNNFRFTGTPGIYLLTVDDNAKTITLEESGSLFLVGAATPGGWDWGNPTEAAQIEVDVWQATLAFSNETFRFFTIRDDWASGLNYPFYENEGYTIDSNFANAQDGDSNFSFIGTPGTYTITVNATDLTITLQ
ncbi:MAG: SusF/SusE family outer membrane protein [Bacteroidota bacterium]